MQLPKRPDPERSDTLKVQWVTHSHQAPNPKRLLKKFTCRMCSQTLKSPVSTPCGHSFCKACLDSKFGAMADVIDLKKTTGRTLRIRKVTQSHFEKSGGSLMRIRSSSPVQSVTQILPISSRQQPSTGKHPMALCSDSRP